MKTECVQMLVSVKLQYETPKGREAAIKVFRNGWRRTSSSGHGGYSAESGRVQLAPLGPKLIGYLCRHVASVKDAEKHVPGVDPSYLWRYTHGTKDLRRYEGYEHLEIKRVYARGEVMKGLMDYGLLRNLSAELSDLLFERDSLRLEVEELREYRQKYTDLLHSSIDHSGHMLRGMLQIAMVPGVCDAIADSKSTTVEEVPDAR